MGGIHIDGILSASNSRGSIENYIHVKEIVRVICPTEKGWKSIGVGYASGKASTIWILEIFFSQIFSDNFFFNFQRQIIYFSIFQRLVLPPTPRISNGRCLKAFQKCWNNWIQTGEYMFSSVKQNDWRELNWSGNNYETIAEHVWDWV